MIQSTHLTYCKPLVLLIIISIEKRLNYLFDLEHPKSKASFISHPNSKLSWVSTRFMNLCKKKKKLFLSKCDFMTLIENNYGLNNKSDDENDCSDNEFYKILSETHISKEKILLKTLI